MAARRLVIVMLVLLGVSTLAAALVPVREPETEDRASTTTQTEKPEPRGRLLKRSVDATGRPDVIEMQVGDQLQLAVHTRRPDQVEIGGLGELGDAGPDAPARFDLLPFERGSHPIRLLEAERTIGRIEVRPRKAAKGKPGKQDAEGAKSTQS